MLGQSALMLARRLDTATADTGSSIAAVMRELKSTAAGAIAAGIAVADPVDEISKRRQERRARA
jgi:hypothetical protein